MKDYYDVMVISGLALFFFIFRNGIITDTNYESRRLNIESDISETKTPVKIERPNKILRCNLISDSILVQEK